MSNEQVKDLSSNHKYRVEIPSIVHELGLDPYEMTLYNHYKKVAGDDGECFQAQETISKKTKMGITKIKEAKKKLQQVFPQIGCPLIKVTERKNSDKSNMSDLVEIIDIWPQNYELISKTKKNNPQSPDDGGGRRQTTGGPSPNGYKEEPIEEEPLKKNVCIVDKENLKSEILQRALKEGLDWTIPELNEAWQRFKDYPNSVTDPYKFIKGIIFNLRDNQRKLDRLNKKNSYKLQPKGEKKCYTPIRKDPVSSKETSSASSSKESVLDLFIRLGKEKKTPSKESTNGCNTQITCLSMLGVMG